MAFSSDKNSAGYPYLAVYDGSNLIIRVDSNTQLTPGKWTFIAATFNGSLGYIYLNEESTQGFPINKTKYTLPSIIRQYNYIGQANTQGDGTSSSIVDDLRFFNKSLTQTQINNIYNQDACNKITCDHNVTCSSTFSLTTYLTAMISNNTISSFNTSNLTTISVETSIANFTFNSASTDIPYLSSTSTDNAIKTTTTATN